MSWIHNPRVYLLSPGGVLHPVNTSDTRYQVGRRSGYTYWMYQAWFVATQRPPWALLAALQSDESQVTSEDC